VSNGLAKTLFSVKHENSRIK